MKPTTEELVELQLLLDIEEAIKRRKSFWEYCLYMDPKFFTPAKEYLHKIANALQLVYEGHIKKIAISLPPRAGKSYLTSLWVTWVIGKESKNPNLSIMRNSYGNKMANKFSYDIREIILGDKFKRTFPYVELKPDKSSVDDWAITTANQSTYFCAGVGGAITGKGCKTAGILDDPIKNIEEGLSNTVLEKTWQWVTSTHYSRFEQGCPNILIGTRWNKKDPIGRAVAEDNGEGWHQIVIPAIDENGKSFCEEVKTTEEYQNIRKITSDFIWESVYQQHPIDTVSLLYPENELKRFTLKDVEDLIRSNGFDAIIGYTDTADEGKDYLASAVIGIKGDKYFLVDVVYTQDPIEVTQPLVADLIIRTNQNLHTVESNSGGKSFALKLRELVNNKSGTYIKWKPTTKNKETRILMMSGFIKNSFYFRSDIEYGSMYYKFLNEVTSYSRLSDNEYDDATDCLTGLAEMVYQGNRIQVLQ